MARSYRAAGSPRPPPKPAASESLRTFAALLLLEAETEEDEFLALLLLKMAEDRAEQERRSRRRGPYNQPKCEEFFRFLLDESSDRQFKAFFRVDRESFDFLLDEIKDDPIFASQAGRPQRPVKYQLATFLLRMGAQGAVQTAGIMAISEGITYTYVYRVGKAFRNIRDQYLAWPGTERRADLARVMEKSYGFPGCIGIGDGTYIFLADKPSINGYAYWCRKKGYALIIQATTDHRGRFTSYDFGWPGSVQDSRVFRNSHLWRHRRRYFRQHEYILVDKGYPLTQFSIRPFTDHDLTDNPVEARRRSKFNRKLSSLRIAVEHAFGRMKGRFPALRSMTGRTLSGMYRSIEAVMIIHNILEERHDDPEGIDEYNGDEDADVDAFRGQAAEYGGDDLGGDTMFQLGLRRRKLLLDFNYPAATVTGYVTGNLQARVINYSPGLETRSAPTVAMGGPLYHMK